MKKFTKSLVVLLAVTAMMVSCYPGDDVSTSDLDTSTTLYHKEDFNPAPASAIFYWSVTQLKGDDDDNIEYNGEIDDEILNTTLDNLVELYGVDNVYIFSTTPNPQPAPDNPNVRVITPNDVTPDTDAAFIPGIILRKNTSAGIIYPPYYPYPPGWCWYCWYPYPPVVGVYEYNTGNVVIGMMDLRKSNPEEPSWLAIVKGLLTSSFDGQRTVKGINKAFDQSPYLN